MCLGPSYWPLTPPWPWLTRGHRSLCPGGRGGGWMLRYRIDRWDEWQGWEDCPCLSSGRPSHGTAQRFCWGPLGSLDGIIHSQERWNQWGQFWTCWWYSPPLIHSAEKSFIACNALRSYFHLYWHCTPLCVYTLIDRWPFFTRYRIAWCTLIKWIELKLSIGTFGE